MRSQAQARIVRELQGKSYARAMMMALRRTTPEYSCWGCIIRWRLAWLSEDVGVIDRNTIKTLTEESELVLTAINDHCYTKQQEMLLSPKSERKALKLEVGELDQKCKALREAFDKVGSAKRHGHPVHDAHVQEPTM